MWESKASFSEDRRYRFWLYRRWAEGKTVLFVCLNASDADEYRNDPTVRRCIGFGMDWGYGAMYLANIFGLKSKDPKELTRVDDPIGDRNDDVLRALFESSAKTVYAWGNHGQYMGRGRQVVDMLGPAWCFGVNKTGEPRHPLYQSRNAGLIRYPRRS